MTSDAGPLSLDDIRRGVECLLFVSPTPLTAREMALALEVDEALVERASRELVSRDPSQSGLMVREVAGGFQMATRPEYAVAVARFVGKRAQKLSRAALECLAIIAYNQPCTLPEVDAIRGVDSSGVVKSLLDKGLIRELGRKDAPGRPVLYGTTEEFLVYFGLKSLDDLPDQAVLEQMVSERAQAVLEGTEDASVEDARRMVEQVFPPDEQDPENGAQAGAGESLHPL